MSDTVRDASKIIAVIGSDGPGSSRNSEEFIEFASGRPSRRGEDFGDSLILLPYGLTLEDTHVVLLEAPLIKFGENISSRLRMIEGWLNDKPTGLHGIIYLHPNGTTTGDPLNDEDFVLIQTLCGTENMTILITGREQYPRAADYNDRQIQKMFKRLMDAGTRMSNFDRNNARTILNALISGPNEGSEWTEPPQGTTTESFPRSVSRMSEGVISDELTTRSGEGQADGTPDVEPAQGIEDLEGARPGEATHNPENQSLASHQPLVNQVPSTSQAEKMETKGSSEALGGIAAGRPSRFTKDEVDGSKDGNGASPKRKRSRFKCFFFKLTRGLFGSERLH